ncbi:two component transcriptional regulator, LuxR family [Abditibacterium utsteinense]|uniref:Two component transcriptional regulator, LuxR family n=1 Tax=Abditibacterium utsteinense TaxID=1960156 RepID=A0A2S8SQ37_9BACT|nr:response regulator transcription factor [Abditibacterium utsteinense]PQV62911.1 two component transcriptional regulator, LuxR family [Abditibacterium utsteinense]
MNILIADDHAILRRGLRHILTDGLSEANVSEAQNGGEVLRLLRQRTFDVLILDINMPGATGLEVVRDVRRDYPWLPVLMLSVYPEEQYALRALKAGASGYLPKESAPEELVKAVLKVIGGGKYITASIAEQMADALQDDASKSLHETLSDREFQVMRLLATGKTISEIAADLLLSVKTISTFRARLLAKMHFKNNAELIHYVTHHGLLD